MLYKNLNNKTSISLDELDLQIIEQLNHDARRPVRTLARHIGINRETARYRLNRLLSEGAVSIVCANNYASLGYQYMFIIGVKVRSGKIDNVARQLQNLRGILAVSLVASHYNIMVWAFARDKFDLTQFLSVDLADITDAISMEIIHTFHHFKMLWRLFDSKSPGLGSQPGNNLSEFEMSLIKILQANPRMTITELADSIGCSRAMAKTTVDKLLTEGAIAFFPIVDPAAIGYNLWVQLFIKTEPSKVKEVADALSLDETTMTVSLITGHWQISTVALFKDSKCLSDYTSEVLPLIPGIIEVETIPLGRAVKFSTNLSDWL